MRIGEERFVVLIGGRTRESVKEVAVEVEGGMLDSLMLGRAECIVRLMSFSPYI